MRSQVQVLAGPPLFSQLRALPPPGRSHPLPAWAASGPHALRAVAPKALPEQATQRPSQGRPDAGDHVPGDLRPAMPQVGEPRRVPGSLPTSGPCATGSSWSTRRSSLPLAEDLPTTTAKPTPLLAQHAWASFEGQAPTRADDQPVVDTVRGDDADSGRPRRVAARRIGALDELTRFGHSRRGNARLADAGCPDARPPNWTPDTGRPHRTADTRSRGRRSRGHRSRGHRTPDTGRRTPDTGHRTQDTGHRTPDTGHLMLLRTGQADKAGPAPDILGHHAERLPAGTPKRVPADGACGARRPMQARR
jgi:hypothetical protein